MAETNKELYTNILKIINEYVEGEETYGDAAQLRIHPATLEVSLIDDPDENLEDFDYYDIGELIIPLTDGSFKPDPDAVQALVSEY